MRLAVFAAVLLVTTPAFAVDAISYRGTLGGSDIIVELTDPAAGPVSGRYSYIKVGGDIPLHAIDGKGLTLSEEAACTEATCIMDADGNIADVPVGATWSLAQTADGGLTGSWLKSGKTGNGLAVTLEEIGRRSLPEDTELTPMGLADSAIALTYASGTVFSAETAPYDYAKMDVDLSEGATETLEGSTYRYVIDPRSKFAFPRVVALSDGSNADAANAALARAHATLNLFAFSCLNTAYAGFSYSGYAVNMEGGSLGDFDGENVKLVYLSPTIVGWTEAGSTYCGGAHPNNHYDSHIIDAKTGAPFALAKVFKGWTATGKVDDYSDAPIDQAAAIAAPQDYFWTAGQDLIDYALAHQPAYGDDFPSECDMDEIISNNLGLRFAPGDKAVFAIEGLPFVSFACTEDIVTVRLGDIPELLAPTARDYFPALAR